VNLWGVVRVLQAVLPHMRAARKGHVINLRLTFHSELLIPSQLYEWNPWTPSERFLHRFPFAPFALTDFAASKFALEGLCDSLRLHVDLRF
jgi:NAD(P)-dependent dehydrogenase (short-subunit alcohol dehydrogenase family)